MGTNINTYVKMKDVDNGVISIYRDETKTEINGVTYTGYGMVASKYNDNKSMMYVDAYGGWIDVSNVTIVEERPVTEPINTGITIVPATISNLNIETGGGDSNNEVVSSDSSGTGSIIGMPYQFMSRVDRRLDDTGFGRKYREKIASRDNFVYFTPGKQVFMPGAKSDERATILANLADMAAGSSPEAIIQSSGRYYGLEEDTSSYYRYVNAACNSVAILMGIGDERVTIGNYTSVLRDFNWQSAKNNSYLNDLQGINHIVVYPDSLNSISEDFGNSTRESSLVSQVNGYSDTIKEINYFMNGSADSPYAQMLNDESFNSTLSGIQNTINNFTGGQGVLQAMLGNSTTILSGGKLVFPELWNDSDYDRSYSIDIKLRTPDADELSIYLNLIVPLIHLMALTAPRDFDAATSSNGYVAPFLIRAYSRALFNIDLGIITSLSVTKGGEANWAAASNLPTSIDVSLTVKDLYKSMYMTKVESGLRNGLGLAKFVANDAEMEQLMNLAGVNMTEANMISKKMSLYSGLAAGKVTGLGDRIGNKLLSDFYNAAGKIFGSI